MKKIKKKKPIKLKKPKHKRASKNVRKVVSRPNSQRSGPVLTMLDNPLSNLTDEQRQELVRDLGENGKHKVAEIFDYFEDFLRRKDAITLISILTGYGLMVGAGKDGVQTKTTNTEFGQAQIELLQALILRIPDGDLGLEPITPDVTQEAWEKLVEISNAFHFSRMDERLLNLSKPEAAVTQIQELIRGHTQVVRNWGFFSQTVQISREIYGNFDELILANLGFTISHAIQIFEYLVETIEARLSSRFQILSELKSIKNTYKMLVRYHEIIGQSREEADRFAESVDIKRMSQKRLFLLLLSHFDLRMGNYYIFETSKVEKETEIDEKEIKRIFDYFSYLPGDLENENKEFFFLENPVWRKPILAVGEQYYCFIPQLFFSFSLEILDEIIEKYDKVGLHDRRSTYLEYKIEEIVKRRFPSSQVVSGLQWESEGIRYETDLVAFIDSHAIIVEAKSQKISRPALRGAPDRIKKHLNEILIEPGIQSFRFENKLNTLINQIEKSDPLLQSLPVNIADIKKIIRVSVSLEDFATLQANLRLFTDTGWIPQDFEPCPSMNLADFETLFDFLEHPVQIIHYLIRRLELEGSIAFLGDELDFMGLYITTLLNKGNFSSDGQSEILISGMSEPLDKYYMSRDQGLSIEKPQPKVSPFFKKILSKLEDRATPRWTEIGCILNRFPPDDQIKISKNIKDLKRVVNRTWKQEGHKNISIYRPPETSEYAMAIVLFKDANRDKRDEFIQAASNFGLEPEHVRYCLVIAINIDRNDLPYHYIGLAEDRARPPA